LTERAGEDDREEGRTGGRSGERERSCASECTLGARFVFTALDNLSANASRLLSPSPAIPAVSFSLTLIEEFEAVGNGMVALLGGASLLTSSCAGVGGGDTNLLGGTLLTKLCCDRDEVRLPASPLDVPASGVDRSVLELVRPFAFLVCCTGDVCKTEVAQGLLAGPVPPVRVLMSISGFGGIVRERVEPLPE